MRIEEETTDTSIIDTLKDENEHLLNTNLELENQINLLKTKSDTHSKILIFLMVFSVIALIVIILGAFNYSKLSSEQEFGKKTLAEQKEVIDNHKQEIEDKSFEISNINEALEESQSKIEELTEEIDNLKTSISKKDDEIEELKNKLSESEEYETNDF